MLKTHARLVPILVILATSFLYLVFFKYDPGALSIAFLDVGQGNATLLTDRFGKRVLIDTGYSNKVLFEISSQIPPWDREIDLIILSHYHADHIGGFLEIIKTYDVKSVLLPEGATSSALGSQIAQAIERYQIRKLTTPIIGSSLQMGEIKLTFYWPPQGCHGKLGDENYCSWVVAASIYNVDVLIPGDHEFSSGAIADDELAQIDILLVPHQGSEGGITDDFIEKYRPGMAVISVGRNSYGHPHPQTLELLKRHRILTLRTDEVGSIGVKIIENGVYKTVSF